jgi:ribosomal-protein-alanine N-acetyltransferase
VIETKRLVLQPVAPALGEALLAGDLSGVAAGEGWPHADTADGLRAALRAGAPFWLVTLDGVAVGDCGTVGLPDAAGDVEIGYGLAAPYRGRGFGSELVEQLAAWLLEQPHVARVTAEVLHDNIPSRRALERAGFAIDRSGEEYVRYARRRQL